MKKFNWKTPSNLFILLCIFESLLCIYCAKAIKINKWRNHNHKTVFHHCFIIESIPLYFSCGLLKIWVMIDDCEGISNVCFFIVGGSAGPTSTGACAHQAHVKIRVSPAVDGHFTIEPAGKFHKCKYWHLGCGRHWNQVSCGRQQHFVYTNSKSPPKQHLQYCFSPAQQTAVWQRYKDNNKCVWKEPEQTESRRTAREDTSTVPQSSNRTFSLFINWTYFKPKEIWLKKV